MTTGQKWFIQEIFMLSKHDLNLLIDYTRIALFNTISINYKYSEQIRYLNKLNCK